jgi:Xaa-Pro aminopeptidase
LVISSESNTEAAQANTGIPRFALDDNPVLCQEFQDDPPLRRPRLSPPNFRRLINSSAMNFLLRQKKLREQLASSGLDALLVSHLPNVRYLCGFTGSAGLLLVAETGSVFFTDVRYDVQAREEVKGAKVVIARSGLVSALAVWFGARRKKSGAKSGRSTLGIEGEHVTVAERTRLVAALPSGVRLKNALALVERARMLKDDGELALIRAAVSLGATLFDRALEVIRPGMRETDVAAEMEYTARRAGAEGMSFPTIIASGARSALPHGRATEQVIAPGGFVVCDFGVILGGYCSDQTRSVWVGRATSVKKSAASEQEARHAYDAVREAQESAIAAVRAGVTAGDVDAAARKVLQKAGLGRYFTHSTGHGVGLEIHEAPKIAAGQKEILQAGMVITIEPGVYLPGKWGVRIEDIVAVREGGCEVLTPTGKEFLTV